MFLYAFRLLQRQPQRLALTVAAIALCAVMMLFLLATYRGVSVGSVEYIRKNDCDVWVAQRNSTNLLRGTSLLRASVGEALLRSPSVSEARPVLLLLPTVRFGKEHATVFLAGYETGQRLGGPPAITDGRGVRGDADIVLDRAFALKMDIAVGDTVSINDMPLRVCGFSDGTNAFVLQYAFVTLRRARMIAGIPDLVSLYLLRITPEARAAQVVREIERDIPGTAAFTREVFLANNLKEMEAGFLPLLFAIAGLGMVVMTVILSLLLGITILERRKDFAMMKTLGAPRGYLPGSIAVQALLLAALGTAAGVAVFPALMFAVESLSPEISTVSSPAQVLLVVAVCLLVSQGSALVSMRRLRGIYALEVYQ